ncbi:MAG: hypothetical protein NTZ56_17170 [Acidobacteria bacterium]|nr:hypothetical protein [Acidobacteriota bacterium]
MLWAWAAVAMWAADAPVYRSMQSPDHPAIRYATAPTENVAARLDLSRLTFDDRFGYLPSLLRELGISPDSQLLVFSKTSFQGARVSPANPRAIYFSAEAAVGWIPGAPLIEIAAVDPKLGPIFYTLAAERREEPRLSREKSCLQCHHGPATLGVPGLFVGSVVPRTDGQPSRLGAIITDHRTAFKDRWGGWFVDTPAGLSENRANAVAPDPAAPQQLEKRRPRFDTSRYLRPASDPVALMTFEHQTLVTNLLTRLHWDWAAGRIDRDLLSETAAALASEGEAPLPVPLAGPSPFAEAFGMRRRSMATQPARWQFDLQHGLVRHGLSFMVESEQYRALPDGVRNELTRRLELDRSTTP